MKVHAKDDKITSEQKTKWRPSSNRKKSLYAFPEKNTMCWDNNPIDIIYTKIPSRYFEGKMENRNEENAGWGEICRRRIKFFENKNQIVQGFEKTGEL